MLTSRSPRANLWLGAAFALLLLAGSGLAWLLARQGAGSRLKVVLIGPVASEGSGLESAQSRAVVALVQDQLELHGRFAITSLTQLPADLTPVCGQARTLLIQLDLRRVGEDQGAYRHRALLGKFDGIGRIVEQGLL